MAITRAQTPASNGANATTVTVTLGSTPTSGNLLVAWANSDSSVAIGGTGWGLLASVVDGNGVYMWAKLAGASEPSAVVFTPGGGAANTTAGLMEYAGVLSATADVVKTSTIAGTAGTTTTAPSAFTTTAAGDLVVALAGLHGSGATRPTTPTWTASLTNQQSVSDGGVWSGFTNCQSFVGDNLSIGVAATYSVSCSWTNAAGDRQEIAAAFKAAASTNTQQPFFRPYRNVPIMRAANW